MLHVHIWLERNLDFLLWSQLNNAKMTRAEGTVEKPRDVPIGCLFHKNECIDPPLTSSFDVPTFSFPMLCVRLAPISQLEISFSCFKTRRLSVTASSLGAQATGKERKEGRQYVRNCSFVACRAVLMYPHSSCT